MDSKLSDALWAYHIAYKTSFKFTPFQLLYGQDATLLVELELPSLRITIDEHLIDEESLSQKKTTMLETLG